MVYSIQALAEMFRKHIPDSWLKEFNGQGGQVPAGAAFLTRERDLGHGVHGTVWAATNLTGKRVAVKEQVVNINEGINRVRSKLYRCVRRVTSLFFQCVKLRSMHLLLLHRPTTKNRFISELNLGMYFTGNRRVVEVHGGDIVVVGDLVKCYLVMERVDMTLGDYLKQHEMGMQKRIEVTSELLEIARFMGELELCHADVKVSTTV